MKLWLAPLSALLLSGCLTYPPPSSAPYRAVGQEPGWTLVIDERRRALFLEGFRNYDLQRFNLPFNPAVGAPFPFKGGSYGNTRCLPLPDVERFNNPNIT